MDTTWGGVAGRIVMILRCCLAKIVRLVHLCVLHWNWYSRSVTWRASSTVSGCLEYVREMWHGFVYYPMDIAVVFNSGTWGRFECVARVLERPWASAWTWRSGWFPSSLYTRRTLHRICDVLLKSRLHTSLLGTGGPKLEPVTLPHTLFTPSLRCIPCLQLICHVAKLYITSDITSTHNGVMYTFPISQTQL